MSSTQRSIPDHLKNSAKNLITSTFPLEQELTSKNSFRKYYGYSQDTSWTSRNLSDQISWHAEAAVSTVQQATIADAFQNTAILWDRAIKAGNLGGHHGSPFSDQRTAVHRIGNNYFQPYTLAHCVKDAIEGSTDSRPIAFPISPGFGYDTNRDLSEATNANTSIGGTPAIEYPSIIRAQLLELSGAGTDHVVEWVELPQDLFLGSTLGVIILLPRLPTQLSPENTALDMVVCNVGAGWGRSSMNITTQLSSTSAVSSAIHMDRDPYPSRFRRLPSRYRNEEGEINQYQYPSRPAQYIIPIFPAKPLQASKTWAEYLNPFVPALNTTVIDVVMKNMIPNRKKTSRSDVLAQDLLTGLMTNGLARTAVTSQLQGTVTLAKGNANDSLDGSVWLSGREDFFKVDPVKSKDWVKLRVDSTIEGYAYNTNSPGPKAAISFLLAYCVLALVHLFYSGISGIEYPT